MKHSIPIAIFIMLIGFVIIVIAFISQILEMQIALALAGAAFVSSGMIQLGQVRDQKHVNQNLEQIKSKLNEIQQELEKMEQPKSKGVVIADVLASGLKYYAEHVDRQKEEEKND